MITINLLPTQRKRVTAPQPNQAVIMLLAGVLAAGSLAVAYYYRHELSGRRARLAAVEDEQNAYKADVAIAQDYQARLDQLQKRKALIDELLFSGPEVARKLNQISDLAPAKVWLEEIRMEVEKKQEQRVVMQGETRTTRTVQVEYTTLTLTGVTEDLANGQTLVAEFISRLQNSPFMADIVGEIKPLYQRAEEWLPNVSAPGAKRPVWRFRISMQVNMEARKGKPQDKTGSERVADAAAAAARS
ncbi:PilN domain-containing protein [bacterium]|nr:PilN domain-containing protein [bacterium]